MCAYTICLRKYEEMIFIKMMIKKYKATLLNF